VIEPSPTRRELEARLRAMLPEPLEIGHSLTDSKPTVATVGLVGVMTGYAWGWLRGRRSKRTA